MEFFRESDPNRVSKAYLKELPDEASQDLRHAYSDCLERLEQTARDFLKDQTAG